MKCLPSKCLPGTNRIKHRSDEFGLALFSCLPVLHGWITRGAGESECTYVYLQITKNDEFFCAIV